MRNFTKNIIALMIMLGSIWGAGILIHFSNQEWVSACSIISCVAIIMACSAYMAWLADFPKGKK